MQNIQSTSKIVLVISCVLGLIFILTALNLFIIFNQASTTEWYSLVDKNIFLLLLPVGIGMFFLAWGTIRQARWVRVPLMVTGITLTLSLLYRLFVVPNVMDVILCLTSGMLILAYLHQTKRTYKGKRLLGLQILTVITLLPITLFLLLSLVFQDQTLEDDSSLQLQTVAELPAESNLYVTLTTLGTELPPAAEEATLLSAEYPAQWNQADATRLLDQLQPHLDAYVIAAEQAYQCPTTVNNFSIEAEMCQLRLLRDYAELAQFAAITEAERGNIILSQAYASAPIKVGRTITESDNVSLIEYFMGIASVNIGLDTLEKLEQENLLNQTVIAESLGDLQISPESLRTPLKRTYLEYRIIIDEDLDFPPTYLYHPNRTRNELNNFMSTVIENNTASCAMLNNEARLTSIEKLERQEEDTMMNALNPAYPNVFGRTYLAMVLSTLSGQLNRVCEINERIAKFTD